MAWLRRSYPGEGAHGGRHDEPPTPRWVKVFGLIFLLITLVFLVLLVTRGPMGTNHGPGRHLSSFTNEPGMGYVTTVPSGGSA